MELRTLIETRARRPAADRGERLDRVCLALLRPGVDGVLGTPDILEDLLLLGALEGMAWQRALQAPNVVGLVVGRTLPYPRGDDVAGAVDRAVSVLPSTGMSTV